MVDGSLIAPARSSLHRVVGIIAPLLHAGTLLGSHQSEIPSVLLKICLTSAGEPDGGP